MPGIPTPNTNLADLVPPLIKGRSSPIISTEPALRDGTRAGGVDPVDPDIPTPAGIIFETDFSQDTGYTLTYETRAQSPSGFTYSFCSGNGLGEVLPVGPGGKNAMRLNYATNISQPTIGFGKVLADKGQGFKELYFRFRMRFPDNFRFGDGDATIPYWKWFRLAQNYEHGINMQHENRPDSYYVVGNISSSPTWGTRWNIAAAGNEEDGTPQERSAGSSGGPHALIDWYAGTGQDPKDRLGHFTRMPGWDIDWTTNKGRFKTFADSTPQEWHTVEFRVKAASAPGADDGTVEIFLDGENQGPPVRIADQFSPDTGPFTGFPTAANPHGWNLISFFDNMTELNKDFDNPAVDGFIDVADLVVSTERIGHSYRVGGEDAPYEPVGVIFADNFDDQPDWTSAMHSTDTVQRASTHTIPNGWHSIRQAPTWAPSTGHEDKHEAIEILASNADKSRSGTGKSYVSYRDAYDAGWNYWASESILLKYFPEGYDELYVEFWIRFSPNWTRTYISGRPSATSKMFRISSWSGDGSEYSAFSDGNIGPIALWDHKLNAYGMRSGISLRGGPHSDNYQLTAADVPSIGGKFVSGSNGDVNTSYTGGLAGMGPGGTDATLLNQVTGGLLTKDSPTAWHDEVFGPGDTWTKLGFYVKMNSAVNVKDGIYRQWINDRRFFNAEDIPWIRSSATRDENAKWNLVMIGGNDFFQTYPNEDRREEWYSIDDLVVRDSIPENLL